MKMKPEDFAVLKQHIEAVVAASPGAAALYKAKGLTHLRYRWDLLYASKLKIGDGAGTKGELNLYAYMNDTHIDTALRAIVGDSFPV